MEKTKTNKKSKTSLIVLLVAILLCIAVVLGMGGFTYAKYISSKTVETQKATVAKWGYVISANTSNLFGKAYESGSISTETDASKVDVLTSASASDTKLVAPGTSGSMTFSITGTAEVRSKITIAVVDDTKATVQLKQGNDVVYEPIKWTLTKDSDSSNVVENVSLDELVTALEDLSVANIDPNTEYTGNNALSYTISWVWVFDAESDDTVDEATDSKSSNLYDTILGALADGTSTTDENGKDITISNGTATVGENSYTATTTVSLDLKISVEQIQGTGTTTPSNSNEGDGQGDTSGDDGNSQG